MLKFPFYRSHLPLHCHDLRKTTLQRVDYKSCLVLVTDGPFIFLPSSLSEAVRDGGEEENTWTVSRRPTWSIPRPATPFPPGNVTGAHMPSGSAPCASPWSAERTLK